MKILIAEREKKVSEEIGKILTKLGYSIYESFGIREEILASIQSEKPDILLLDIRFGDQTQNEMEIVRQIKLLVDIPIIYLIESINETILQILQTTEPFGYIFINPIQEVALRITIEIAVYKYRYERQTKESSKWLAITLKSIGDGIIASDANGKVKFMNPAAEILTGFSEVECIGKSIKDIIKISNIEKGDLTNDILNAAFLDKKTLNFTDNIFLESRRGKRIPIISNVSSIRNDYDEILGVVFSLNDITELQEARNILARKVEVIEAEKKLLEVYFPENLVDFLVDEKHVDALSGRNVDATLMFIDIRNSTEIAETISPENFAIFLSEFHSGIMDLTYANGGSVNKILGDGMLITFGCPFPNADDPHKCVRLALQIREYLKTYNEIKPEFLKNILKIGIGISSGTVFAGNIGYNRRMDYTVLGDAVNTASRIESLTKLLGVDILIDIATNEKVQEEIETISLGSYSVRGKSTNIEVFFPKGML